MSTEPVEPNYNLCDDEVHIAMAIHLLHKAMILREQPDHGVPTIHGCLRDAAEHCELARKRWTREGIAEVDEIGKKLFGDAYIPE